MQSVEISGVIVRKCFDVVFENKSLEYDEIEIRGIFVNLLQSARQRGIPATFWLTMRVSPQDRTTLIQNILYNCELKISKSNEPPKSLVVSEKDRIPALSEKLLKALNNGSLSDKDKLKLKNHFTSQKVISLFFFHQLIILRKMSKKRKTEILTVDDSSSKEEPVEALKTSKRRNNQEDGEKSKETEKKEPKKKPRNKKK